MKGFKLYQLALQLVAAMRSVHARIRQHDRDQAIQIKRATNSVPANIAEGARRQGGDRLHLYRVAAGSASELRGHIEVSLAWGDLDPPTAQPALLLLDSILATLWRLTH
jgi:four helix bundle protein